MAPLEPTVEKPLFAQQPPEPAAQRPPHNGGIFFGEDPNVQGQGPCARRAQRLFERAGSKSLEQPVLVGHDVEHAADRFVQAWVALHKGGNHAVADVRPQGRVFGIGGVLPPADAAVSKVGPQRRARLPQQRAHHDAPRRPHARQAGRPGPFGGTHEKGLNPVVGGMGHQDAGRLAGNAAPPSRFSRQVPGGPIAHLARGLFHIAAGRQHPGHVGPQHMDRDAQALPQLAHKGLVAVGSLATQAMVDMENDQPARVDLLRPLAVEQVELAQDGPHQQSRGVRPAAHHKDDRG